MIYIAYSFSLLIVKSLLSCVISFTDTVDGYCQSGWTEISDSCYWVPSKKGDRDECFTYCKQYTASLTSLTSAVEHNEVVLLL